MSARLTPQDLNAAIQFCDRSAPHLTPILRAVRDSRVAFLSVPQNAGAFVLRFDRPSIILLGDDRDEAFGPAAFHQKSIVTVLREIAAATVIAAAPERSVYAAVAFAAAVLRQHCLIVETRERYEADWTDLIRKYCPDAPLLIHTVDCGTPGLQ